MPKVFILDVDGVLTTGQMFYTAEGKAMKVFGPDDNDALCLLKPHLEIRFVSSDSRGFPISRKRVVEDMKFPLDLVPTAGRLQWIAERYDPADVIFMGDGIFDHYVLEAVGYGIAPANASIHARNAADYVTRHAGGDRAVAEACLHVLEKFFEPYVPSVPLSEDRTAFGRTQAG
ncbi:MAG: HAD hydrolase family protein [Planctomycetales bacterium]